MTYWLPKLQAAGLPTPRTTMVEMPEAALRDVFRVFDGEKMMGDAEPFAEEIKAAAAEIGYPVFLRTGHTSAKHSWEDTCFLADPGMAMRHIIGIVEFSEMADIRGLPCRWWAVREFLPTKPLAVCQNYSGMPVCKEFRVFVDGGKVVCHHPYWPLNALEHGGASNAEEAFAELCRCDDIDNVLALAAKAGAAVGGAWSVDVLDTARGWFVTDMAEAKKSWHWPDCKHGESAGLDPVVAASGDDRCGDCGEDDRDSEITTTN